MFRFLTIKRQENMNKKIENKIDKKSPLNH